MAGNISFVLFFALFLGLVSSFMINPSECLPKGTALNCQWRGKGNYVVSAPLKQEILTIDKMFDGSSMTVPPQFRGNLMKIKISLYHFLKEDGFYNNRSNTLYFYGFSCKCNPDIDLYYYNFFNSQDPLWTMTLGI